MVVLQKISDYTRCCADTASWDAINCGQNIFFNTTVPPDAQEDDGGIEVVLLERGLMLLRDYDSQRLIDKQTNGL